MNKRFVKWGFLILCFCGFILTVQAQSINIKGRVTDKEGLPLIGVTIYQKNSKNGTVSDLDGDFQLSVPEKTTLVFSYVGFNTVEIPAEISMDVKMTESKHNLDEVIVVGYGTQSKRLLTTSISKVGENALDGVPISSVGEALKGKIPGVRLYSSNNAPGSNPVIRIRGGSSVNKTNDPLILIDGVERGFADLNPNDIASIEVLKDAASTAIYGSRASNGVILVTTKEGSNNKAHVTFESTMAVQSPETLYDFMNAEDYLRTVRPAVAVGPHPEYNWMDGYSGSSGNTSSSIYSTRYLKDGETVPAGYKSMIDPLDPTKTLIFQDNDWQKEIYRNCLWQNYYLGVNGGNKSVKYDVSAGYIEDGGVAIATGYSRFNVHSNLDIKISEKLSLQTGIDFSNSTSREYPNQRNVIVRGLMTPPTEKKYNDDGTPTKGYNSTSYTPIWYQYYNDQNNRYRRMSAYGKLTYYIFDGLKAQMEISNYDEYGLEHSFQKANEYSSLRPITESYSGLTRNKLEIYATYNKSLGLHSFSAMGGYSYQKEEDRGLSASADGASSDKVPTLTASPDKKDATSSRTWDILVGYFGRLTYDYKKKYLFSETFREDASSRFTKGHQWGFFPGASLGWIVSEEPFMKRLSAVDNLKLRCSYGQTGNNSIGLYDAYGLYSTNVKYGGNAGINPSTMPNNDLTWEETNQLDAGFDLSLFGERLSVSADYFDKRTKNLLFSVTLPNTSGFSSVQENTGEVKFYGYDLEINSINIQTENFRWDTRLTWSYIKNKVLKLPYNGRDKNRIGGITLADGTAFGGIAEGESLYSYYGYVADHIIETQKDADNALYDDNAIGYRNSDGKKVAGRKEIGDYEWKNRAGSDTKNGKEIIDSQDQFLLGYTVPHTTGGLNNTFTYKNLSLTIYLDWALGHSIYNEQEERYFMNTFANNSTLLNEVKKCWKKVGDNTKYARFTANDADDGNRNFSRTSNIFNYKGDYLCIREISLQYNFPYYLIKKMGISNMAVTLSGNTLYYFTAVKGVSPEVGTSSTYSDSYDNYPPIRKISLGVKIIF
jgi:TonB-linked SusC/RagA family outer membrane protein